VPEKREREREEKGRKGAIVNSLRRSMVKGENEKEGKGREKARTFVNVPVEKRRRKKWRRKRRGSIHFHHRALLRANPL